MIILLSRICDTFDWHQTTIEKWISDGYFQPSHHPGPGLARDWSRPDIARLICFMRMAAAGIDRQVGKSVPDFSDLRNGYLRLVIQRSEKPSGSFNAHFCDRTGLTIDRFNPSADPNTEWCFVLNLRPILADAQLVPHSPGRAVRKENE